MSDELIQIQTIRIFGGYLQNKEPVDHFRVIIHESSANLPGDTLSDQEEVPTTRQRTGHQLGAEGLDEWEFVLDLPVPVLLPPGTYFVEIFNQPTSAVFFWECGVLDPANGIEGSALDNEVPGDDWSALGDEMAIVIEGEPVTPLLIPTTDHIGLGILGVLLALTGLLRLRSGCAL